MWELRTSGSFSHLCLHPVAQVIYRWEKELLETQDLELPNGSLIADTAIWQELQAASAFAIRAAAPLTVLLRRHAEPESNKPPPPRLLKIVARRQR